MINSEPTLFWPVYDDSFGAIKDVDCFPGRGSLARSIIALKGLKNSEHQMFLGRQIFWRRFIESKDVIFIDKYFSLQTLEKMFYELDRNEQGSHPASIFILCYNEYKPISEEVKKRNKYADILVQILPNRDTAYYIHDRFAIMDDEIWHFGSSIGGAEAHVNAFSGPWEDKNGKFREYAMHLIGARRR